MRQQSLLLALAACAACIPQSPATNPYDPATPVSQQATADIVGTLQLAAPTLGAEAPLLGGSVKLSGNAQPEVQTSSDANGLFTFSRLVPGTYELTATHPSGYPLVIPVTLRAGQTLTQAFALTPITQTNTSSTAAHLTGSANRGAGSTDSSGIVVELVNTGIRTVTDTAGQFDLFVAPGVYDVQFTAVDYNPATRTGETLIGGQTKTISSNPVTLTPNPAAASGTVQLEGLVTGAWGGVTLSLPNSTAGSAQSQADGTFLVSGAAAGTYTLTASAPGYATQNIGGVVLHGGATTAVPTLTLALSRGTVSGTVLLSGSADSSGTTVTLSGANPFSATTDPNGLFIITGVPIGPYTLTARHAGYVTGASGAFTVSANTSTAAPAVTLLVLQGAFTINSGALYTNNANVMINISTAQASAVRVSQDANFADPTQGDTAFHAVAANSNFALTGADGTKTLYAQYQDASQVVSNTFASSIVLDRQPPTVSSFSINGNSTYTRVPAVSLQISAAADGSGVAGVRISPVPLTNPNAFVPYVSTMAYTFSPALDGSKTLYAYIQDGAGNISSAAVANIILDTTAPTSTVAAYCGNATSPSSLCNASLVTLLITSSSSDAAQVQVANDPTFAGSSAFAITAGNANVAWVLSPGDGLRTVYVQAIDNAGNVQSPATQTSITVDTHPPTSPSVVINGGAQNTNTTAVALALSAVQATTMQISNVADFSTGSGVIPYATSQNWTISTGDGTHTIYVQYGDAALNVSAVAAAHINLDTVPPSITSVTPVTNVNAFVNALSLLTTVNVTGATQMVVGCNGSLAGQGVEGFATSVTCLLPPTDGVKNVVFSFLDEADNSATSNASVYYDATPPTPPAIETRSATTQATTASIDLGTLSSDAPFAVGDPGTQRFIYQVKGGSSYADWTDCGTSMAALDWPQSATCSGPPFGFNLNPNENRLSIRARDRAGNVSTEDTVVLTQDSVAPGVVLHQNSDGSLMSWGTTWSSADLSSGDGYTIVSWEPPGDVDVGGYLLYYGFSHDGSNPPLPTSYRGTFADQGASPINVGNPCKSNPTGNDCAFRITGATNGTGFYVTVAAYDKTTIPGPNVGPLAGDAETTPGATVLTRVSSVAASRLSTNASALVRGVWPRDGLVYVATGNDNPYGPVTNPNGNLAVVDATDPANPNVLSISTATLAGGYDIYVRGNYAYVADGPGGLCIFDITNPTTGPVLRNTVTFPSSRSAARIVGRDDDIFVVTYAYPAGAGGQDMYWLSTAQSGGTPALPVIIYDFGNTAAFSWFDADVQGDTLTASTQNGNIVTFDLTQANPNATLSATAIPGGWPAVVSMPGAIAIYYGSGNAVNSLLDPTPQIAATTNSIFRMTYYGGKLYSVGYGGIDLVQMHSDGSLAPIYSTRDLSTTDPLLNTNGPKPGSIRPDGNYVYVGAHNKGLYIYEATAVRSIGALSERQLTTNKATSAMTVVKNTLVQFDDDFSLSGRGAYVLTTTNPSSLGLINSPSFTFSTAVDLRADGDTVSALTYNVSTRTATLDKVHISGYGNGTAVQVSTPFSLFRPQQEALRWPYAYVVGSSTASTQPDSLLVANVGTGVSTTTSFGSRITQSCSNNGGGIAIYSTYAYVGACDATPNIFVYDITTPTSPSFLTSLSLTSGSGTAEAIIGMQVYGSRLYVLTLNGLAIYSLASPAAPTLLANYLEPNGDPVGFAVSGTNAYVGGAGYLDVLNVQNPNNVYQLAQFGAGILATHMAVLGDAVVVSNASGLISLPTQALQLK